MSIQKKDLSQKFLRSRIIGEGIDFAYFYTSASLARSWIPEGIDDDNSNFFIFGEYTVTKSKAFEIFNLNYTFAKNVDGVGVLPIFGLGFCADENKPNQFGKCRISIYGSAYAISDNRWVDITDPGLTEHKKMMILTAGDVIPEELLTILLESSELIRLDYMQDYFGEFSEFISKTSDKWSSIIGKKPSITDSETYYYGASDTRAVLTRVYNKRIDDLLKNKTHLSEYRYAMPLRGSKRIRFETEYRIDRLRRMFTGSHVKGCKTSDIFNIRPSFLRDIKYDFMFHNFNLGQKVKIQAPKRQNDFITQVERLLFARSDLRNDMRFKMAVGLIRRLASEYQDKDQIMEEIEDYMLDIRESIDKADTIRIISKPIL